MDTLPQHIFARRRARLMEAMGDQSVAVFVGPPPRNRSNDTDYPYRPSSDILYLSGFREPKTVLVLAPGHPEGEFVMFTPDRDPSAERWDGRRAGPEGAMRDFGADAAFGLSELQDKLPDWFQGRKQLYYTLGSDDEFDRQMIEWMQTLRHRRHGVARIPSTVVDVRDLVHKARLTKDDDELALVRRACEISSQAHILAMQHCQPGMHEYELQALVEYHFRRSGGEGPAYTSIVGAGDNATILHYTDNDSPITDGDVVLIDAGCEFQFYAGDITRSFPANGQFTGPQRDIYQAVLEVQRAAIDDLEHGFSYETLRENTRRRLTEKMVDLGLLEGAVDALVEDKKYRDYYPHSIGHPLGIDVHDVGLFRESEDDSRCLVEGMVLTVEPGLYVPADADDAPASMRGIGVRIEDDVLITADGSENLTADCPKEVAAIEALVGSKELPL